MQTTVLYIFHMQMSILFQKNSKISMIIQPQSRLHVPREGNKCRSFRAIFQIGAELRGHSRKVDAHAPFLILLQVNCRLFVSFCQFDRFYNPTTIIFRLASATKGQPNPEQKWNVFQAKRHRNYFLSNSQGVSKCRIFAHGRFFRQA